MLLVQARQLAIELGTAAPEHWPDLMPDGLELVTESGDLFIHAICSPDGPVETDPFKLHVAIDEWLLTTDRDRLTAEQRAVCGCALLEVFCEYETAREAPGILTALDNIVPVVPTMTDRSINLIAKAIDELQARREVSSLADDEVALLTLAKWCAELVVGRPNNMNDVATELDVIRRDSLPSRTKETA